ncbi:hypothetical protein ACUOFC_68140, partial [Escherichia sp. TWPC-MK]
ATVGLDILAAIGSDIALMQLNGIAQKLKFKALQERAKEKIADIAESSEPLSSRPRSGANRSSSSATVSSRL